MARQVRLDGSPFLAGNRGTGNGGDRYQVMVHVDQDPLAPNGALAATLEDGTRTFRGNVPPHRLQSLVTLFQRQSHKLRSGSAIRTQKE